MADPCQRAMYLDAIPKQAAMLLGAGALIVPCFRQPTSLLGPKNDLHELNGFASIWACIENILIAAASEGIHAVTKIISTEAEAEHVRSVLGVPPEFAMPCYLAMGYPAEGVSRLRQVRVSLDERIHVDRWSADDPATAG